MTIFDFLIVLVVVAGAYMMRINGFIKNTVDLIVIYITTIISSFLSVLLFNLIYKYLPFFNLFGKAQGLKIINVFLWRTLLYLIIFLLFIHIVRKIFIKTGLENKLSDTAASSGIIGMITGGLVSSLTITLIIFNFGLIFLFPGFNFKNLNKSTVMSMIMTKMPIISKQNMNFYYNQSYTIKRINKSDNNYIDFEIVSEDIISNMLDSEFLSEDVISYLQNNDKIVGTKTKKETNEDTDSEEDFSDDDSYDNSSKKSNKSNKNNTIEEDDSEEYYDDEYDEEYYEEDDSEEYYDDEYDDEYDEEYYEEDDEYYDFYD